ncbi:hypothetical protein AB0J80_08570 [Actinoplanes sp. NPDC049548]|uniref:hypothetical protein n=1 Tax=Actinoplanes sp. NPDC049548 TaxID=3155152 RepID=UPI0034364911
MSDYNWFSDQAVEVAVDGLEKEAEKWHELAGRMRKVSQAAQGQSLQATAFAVTDAMTGAVTAMDLKAAYDTVYEWLNSLFAQAAQEFDSMGDALTKNAKWYANADADVAQNFDAIASS